MGTRHGMAVALGLAALAVPQVAWAFGGAVVSRREGDPPVSDAAMVVLAREGDHTVMALRVDLRGPAEDLALVVPVPSPIEASDVRVLRPAALSDLDAFTAPRLHDYLERDPCWNPNVGTAHTEDGALFESRWRGSLAARSTGTPPGSHFRRHEYDMTILSAADSRSVGAWLSGHGYHVPEAFEAAVRPHLERGDRFVVARIAPDQLELVRERRVLSPIRIHYRSDRLALPIGLGALNRRGAQELVVVILARDSRYDITSRPHATIPTHYRVDESVRARFDDFYSALFEQTLERHPGAVVTEWATEIGGLRPSSQVFAAEDLHALAAPLMGPPPVRRFARDQRGIALGDFEVDRDLRAPLVEGVLRRTLPGFAACGRRRVGTVSSANEISVQLTIAPSGAVQSVRTDDGLGEVEACLGSALEHTLFPTPDDHQPASVRFRIRPAAEGPPEAPPVIDPPWDRDTTLVVSRLHLRSAGADEGELVFGPAEPITGGTYTRARGNEGPWLVRAARPYERNELEARYFVGHPWERHIACGEAAIRGVWESTSWSDELADAPEPGPEPGGEVVLEDVFLEDVPELELTPRNRPVFEHEEPPTALAPLSTDEPTPTSGCGCRSAGPSSSGAGLLVAALAALAWRRRRGGNHCVR